MEYINIHQSRRNFLRGRGKSRPSVRPPWAVEESQFLQGCTRCDKCIKICPEAIIVRGDGGFPIVRFDLGECTFCEKCIQSCPDGVLVKQDGFGPWKHKVEIQKSCIVYKGVVCMTCRDQCEPRAIEFPLVSGPLRLPVLNAELCNGCGACIRPCPSEAIQIVG
jgi:ferredoxin-type protein NapF